MWNNLNLEYFGAKDMRRKIEKRKRKNKKKMLFSEIANLSNSSIRYRISSYTSWPMLTQPIDHKKTIRKSAVSYENL
jgi:hypothetical protein